MPNMLGRNTNRALSANCTMGNLTCSRHATYLHTIYAKSRKIHILSTMQILAAIVKEELIIVIY